MLAMLVDHEAHAGAKELRAKSVDAVLGFRPVGAWLEEPRASRDSNVVWCGGGPSTPFRHALHPQPGGRSLASKCRQMASELCSLRSWPQSPHACPTSGSGRLY